MLAVFHYLAKVNCTVSLIDDSDVIPSTSASYHSLRSGNVHEIGSSPSSGVLEKKYIFCKRLQKKVKGKWQSLTQCVLDSAEDLIKKHDETEWR